MLARDLLAESNDVAVWPANSKLAKAPWLRHRTKDDVDALGAIRVEKAIEVPPDVDPDLTRWMSGCVLTEREVDVDGMTPIADHSNAGVDGGVALNEVDFESESIVEVLSAGADV